MKGMPVLPWICTVAELILEAPIVLIGAHPGLALRAEHLESVVARLGNVPGRLPWHQQGCRVEMCQRSSKTAEQPEHN